MKGTLNQVLKNSIDRRTRQEFSDNILKGNVNGKSAIQGYCSYLLGMSGDFAHFKYYDEKMWEKDNDASYDCDLQFQNQIIPFEVKVSKSYPNYIYIRYGIKYVNKQVSNLHILIAEKSNFSVLKVSELIKISEPFFYPEWNKWTYKVERDILTWDRFLRPINII